MENIKEQLVNYRRKLHQIPEAGYLEMLTTIQLIKEVRKLGFTDIRYGKEIHKNRIGLPNDEKIKAHAEMIEDQKDFDVSEIKEGYTGLIVDYDTKKPGPKIAFRFEIDGLLIEETEDPSHIPNKENFKSKFKETMHACGHDGHMAIGLCLAEYIIQNKDLSGSYRIIFQPAEEGVHGAKSLLEAGVVDGVDYLFGLHIGMRTPTGTIGVGTRKFLATKKFDIDLKGKASHAGIFPERGKNALLGAASLSLILHSELQNSKGMTRLNVGLLNAGSERNIVPGFAHLELEIRGENDDIVSDLEKKVRNSTQGISLAYDLEYDIKLMGSSITFDTKNEDFRDHLNAYLEKDFKTKLAPAMNASEDICYLLAAVEENGGKALHFILGSNTAASHHNNAFDIDEDSLYIGYQMFVKTIDFILKEENK